MRKAPSFSPPPLQSKAALIQEIRNYKLITPMFGGGAVPQKADDDLVIRASSIRGQLRFWWRATRGFALGSLTEMKRREDEIFGSTDKPSPLRVKALVSDKGTTKKPFEWRPNGRAGSQDHVAHPYVSFPLQPPQGTPPGTLLPDLRFDVKFEVRLAYPKKDKEDVEAALWAWENFGGIGGRTRRGFGAIERAGLEPRALDSLLAEASRHVAKSKDPIKSVTRLHIDKESFASTAYRGSSTEAWRKLIECYKNFRQDRPPGNPMPGRSFWPEPDSIRIICNTFSPNHEPRIPDKKPHFPRAFFGLPIITKFKGDRDGEPQQTSLQPLSEDKKNPLERRASPLFLRPIAVGPNSYVGLAFLTRPFGLPPEGLVLLQGRTEKWRSGPFSYEQILTFPHSKKELGYPFSPFFKKVREVR